MNTYLRVTACIVIVLAAWPVVAGQEPVKLDLSKTTAIPDLEYILEMGTVLRDGAPTLDVAICLSRAKITPNGLYREPSGELVAFIAANEKVVEEIATAETVCKGPECNELVVKVVDHNVEIDPTPIKRTCADPRGIARPYGYKEITLGELRSKSEAEVSVSILNTYDDSWMGLRVSALFVWQTCEVPDDDTDIRYGRNFYADLWSPSPWIAGFSLFVCSEGVRVCSFSSDFMSNEFNEAVIRANDLDNTVVHASREFGYHGGHECGLAYDMRRGAIGRYYIEGWVPEWQIGLRINALGGNDWVLGSPEPDLIMGGDGDDLLRGMGGGSNRIFGEGGNDIMHDSPSGICDGGPPEVDTSCMFDPWDWPNPYPAGDCCCHSCGGPPRSCFYSDLTPGVAEVPPDPW